MRIIKNITESGHFLNICLFLFILYINRLFIIEGAPSVLLAFLAAWYLPNSPETAKFLSKEEKELEISRLEIGKEKRKRMVKKLEYYIYNI